MNCFAKDLPIYAYICAYDGEMVRRLISFHTRSSIPAHLGLQEFWSSMKDHPVLAAVALDAIWMVVLPMQLFTRTE